MKNYFFGVFTILFLNFTTTYLWWEAENDSKLDDFSYKMNTYLDNQPLIEVITGRCRDIEGKKMNQRVWFGCNKIQIFLSDLIYGE